MAATTGVAATVVGGVAATVVGGVAAATGVAPVVVLDLLLGLGLVLPGLLLGLLVRGLLLLLELGLDLGVEAVNVGLGGLRLGVELVGLTLLVGNKLLLLFLILLEGGLLLVELGLDRPDGVDGLLVARADLLRVVDVVGKLLEARGLEHELEQRDAAALVVGGDAVGQRGLGLLELALLRLDVLLGLLDALVGLLELVLGVVELLGRLLGLAVKVVEGRLCAVELSLELGRGLVGQRDGGKCQADAGDGNGCRECRGKQLRCRLSSHGAPFVTGADKQRALLPKELNQ